MIKYYCDICKKEITDGKVFAEIRCRAIPRPGEIGMYLHKQCLIDFIGADTIAKMQAEADERKKAAEERRKERLKEREENE